jgi:hypothetical protein
MRSSLRAALVPFLAARAIVIAVLGVCRLLTGPMHAVTGAKAVGTVHAGLLSWDATYYLRIAEVGYGGAGRASLRFFPLFPLAGRALAWVPGVSDGAALIVIANVAAFGALVALHALVRSESLGKAVASTSVWLLALWPAAFVLVMGYAEALFMFASIVAFACWRTGRFGASILPAFAAGLTRPTGILLAVPAAVEAFLAFRSGAGPSRASGARPAVVRYGARILGVLAAPAGAGAYLGWVGSRFGSVTLPLRQQLSPNHRGSIGDPFVTFAHDVSDIVSFHHLGVAMHAPFAVVFLALTIYACFRLPAAYGWYAVATMAVGLTAPNLDSFERYGLACFPLAVALACLLEGRLTRWAVLGTSAAALATLSACCFVGVYVP